MWKAHFFSLFLIFYFRQSFSDQLDTVNLVEYAIKVIRQIEEINSVNSREGSILPLLVNEKKSRSVLEAVVRLKLVLQVRFQDIQFNEKVYDEKIRTLLSDCDIHNSNWFSIENDDTFKKSEKWIDLANCLEMNRDHVRELMSNKFSALITETLTESSGECVGPIAFDTVHKFYLLMINSEINLYLMSSGVHVADADIPDFSIQLRNEYLKLTKILLSFLKEVQPRFSKDCNGENKAPTQDDSFVELIGLYKETIFQYNYNECGGFTWRCDDMLESYYLERCDTKWIDERLACAGKAVVCKDLGDIETCIPALGDKLQYIESYQLGLQGDKSQSCFAPADKLIKISSSSDPPLSTCHCRCISEQLRIDLRQIESDTRHNYVVVGVRFALVNRMLTLRVAEGKLRSLGYVTDFRWIPTENITENAQAIHHCWLSNAILYFITHHLQLQFGQLITGILFEMSSRHIRHKSFPAVSIGIIGMSFHFETGFLHHNSKSLLKLNKDTFPKDEYEFVPVRQSELEVDFGQTTLPLFDAPSSLIPEKLEALYGIKMYHKNLENQLELISFECNRINSYQIDGYIENIEGDEMTIE